MLGHDVVSGKHNMRTSMDRCVTVSLEALLQPSGVGQAHALYLYSKGSHSATMRSERSGLRR